LHDDDLQQAATPDVGAMRILTWNVNHKTRQKDIPPRAVALLLSLAPDVVVLTEYVHGASRAGFLDAMAAGGLRFSLVSERAPNENQVLIQAISIPILPTPEPNAAIASANSSPTAGSSERLTTEAAIGP
jgi:hypothetical protein